MSLGKWRAGMYLTPHYHATAFYRFYQRLVARGMRKSAALGHVAGKLASVLYCCLKPMTAYDEKKHLQEMGFTKENEPYNVTWVRCQNFLIQNRGFIVVGDQGKWLFRRP